MIKDDKIKTTSFLTIIINISIKKIKEKDLKKEKEKTLFYVVTTTTMTCHES